MKNKVIIERTIVVLTEGISPILINNNWIDDASIINKGGNVKQVVLTADFAIISTEKFSLTVLPEQIRFSIFGDNNITEFLDDVLFKIMQLYNNVRYKAAGVNINVKYSTEENISTYSKGMFYVKNPLFNYFDSDGTKYGAFLSKKIFSSTLNLDIKPVKDDNSDEFLMCNFNYHKDTSNLVDVLEHLSNCEKYSSETTEIMNML